MTNFDLSHKVFEFFTQAEVSTVIVCAGARNAPLVMALEKSHLKVIPFFEERSASFFALGLIKAYGKPVAIICTSGTAVAEILPAAIEATYQGLPLVIVSADRPKSYRQSGAPQSIQQVGLFSSYVESVHDLDVHSKNFDFEWSLTQPIHLNVCFDEPLIDQSSSQFAENPVRLTHNNDSSFSRHQIEIKNPLIIVSELAVHEIKFVQNFLVHSKAMIYAESLSQLSKAENLQNQLLKSSNALIKKVFQEKSFDAVIRIGGIPTIRFWRDLEFEFAELPVFNFTKLKYSGLARSSQMFNLAQLSDVVIKGSTQGHHKILRRDQDLQKNKLELIKKYPFSEQACVYRFSEINGSRPLYLGNSLPIRHWDAFTHDGPTRIAANRGANGIDGQVSTYLGWSENLKSSACLIGDLTAMYDLAALGLAAHLQPHNRQIVVLNNYGGQIFKRVFKNDLFINPHQIQFQHWAKMWNWDYLLINRTEDWSKLIEQNILNTVIEIQPDADQTKLFWDEWDKLCQKI